MAKMLDSVVRIWPVRGEGGVKLFVLGVVSTFVPFVHIHGLVCTVLHWRPASGRSGVPPDGAATTAQASSDGTKEGPRIGPRLTQPTQLAFEALLTEQSLCHAFQSPMR